LKGVVDVAKSSKRIPRSAAAKESDFKKNNLDDNDCGEFGSCVKNMRAIISLEEEIKRRKSAFKIKNHKEKQRKNRSLKKVASILPKEYDYQERNKIMAKEDFEQMNEVDDNADAGHADVEEAAAAAAAAAESSRVVANNNYNVLYPFPYYQDEQPAAGAAAAAAAYVPPLPLSEKMFLRGILL